MINPSLKQKVAKHLESLSVPMTTGMRVVIQCDDCEYNVVATNAKEAERAAEYMRSHKDL